MIERRLSEVATVVGGRAVGADVTVTSAASDSRAARPGSLFVALPGERVDGHDFVAAAAARGATAALVSRPVVDAPYVEVADTGAALLALAADERGRRPDTTIVGITGANGKTSTKDLTAAVLATRFRTHASPASFNTEVGLPITLLGAPTDAEVIVAEMGARRIGDVALLCRIARPQVVVVTNVGVAHMEIFGSWEAIVEASAEPVEALEHDGLAVLNADDPVVRGYAERSSAPVRSFGLSGDADVRAANIEVDVDGHARFGLWIDGHPETVELAVPGEHMVSNALAAAAVASSLGVSAAECAAALKDARVSAWRMESFATGDDVRVVNDAYNANPESMAAGLKAARWMARDARLVAVLGHMAELGPISLDEHERLGELIVRVGVDLLITVGEQARMIHRAAVREGQLPEAAIDVDSPEEAFDALRSWLRPGDVVFIKGSRVVALERLAEALR
ncbi:MAG TPA: UDP-N-acetylmuramoyl-tripeptide--D-alanyl-D-alanine ligase [Actinomycetota bacterium]|nr:UDP-N-acetylmuramoyl-tripeptide--D-alanyl-D-alanine ligase [Actinomycetota bacterium]